MSNDKKSRTISLQGWLTKSTQKAATASAAGFLAAHREFLTTGELATKTTPVLAQFDRGEIYPTPTLLKMQSIVLDHMVQIEKNKAAQASAVAEQEVVKNWVASVYTAEGKLQTRIAKNGEIVELIEAFEKASDADNFCDRYLF